MIYEYVGPLDILGSPQDAHGWLGWALGVKSINRHHSYILCTILHSVMNLIMLDHDRLQRAIQCALETYQSRSSL